MPKRVFDNSMVAHVWAQQNQASGRSNNGQFYFDGPTIYSYGSHFPIARFVTNKRGERAVLFTTRDYSMTTRRHKSEVRSALRGDVPVFYVADPEKDFHKDNIEAMRAGFARECEKFLKSTPSTLLHGLGTLQILAERANNFAAFFGIRSRLHAPKFKQADLDKIEARALKKREHEAVKSEKRAAANAAQVEAYRADFRAGAHHESANQGYGYSACLTDADRAEHAINYPLRALRLADVWRSGGDLDYHERRTLEGATLMRISGDEIETSRGARFPIEHGKRAFEFIAARRMAGQAWERNGHSIHLGHFAIDRIEADGTVRAGCHVVEWPEIERMALALGLLF